MSHEDITEAIEYLSQGLIIAYPTDTLYGLGVDALNTEAIESLYRLKMRSSHRPMSIMVPRDTWRDWVHDVPEYAETLARKYFPGPITMIMRAGSNLPDILTKSTNGTIGIRVPNHPICLELLKTFQHPIITTSANLSNKPAAKTPDEIRDYFGDKIAIILENDEQPTGIASTVIDVSDDEPIVIREGAISSFAITRAIK